MDLSNIIDKIANAVLSESPFKHTEINDLFESNDFNEIVLSPEIMRELRKTTRHCSTNCLPVAIVLSPSQDVQ